MIKVDNDATTVDVDPHSTRVSISKTEVVVNFYYIAPGQLIEVFREREP